MRHLQYLGVGVATCSLVFAIVYSISDPDAGNCVSEVELSRSIGAYPCQICAGTVACPATAVVGGAVCVTVPAVPFSNVARGGCDMVPGPGTADGCSAGPAAVRLVCTGPAWATCWANLGPAACGVRQTVACPAGQMFQAHPVDGMPYFVCPAGAVAIANNTLIACANDCL